MMKRTDKGHTILDDPRLDRLFTEAYRDTLSKVEGLEKEKRMADHLEAYAELFRDDLCRRDLSPVERDRFVEIFRTRLRVARQEEEQRKLRNRKRRSLLLKLSPALLVVGAIYILAAQPFKPVSNVEAELKVYYEKVDEGIESYAKRYFTLLNKHSAKLGDSKEEDYRARMERELDEHFTALLTKVEAGELQYADDAKDWAKQFPDKEDRDERIRRVNNAFQEGLAKAVGGTWDTVKRETDSFLDEVVSTVKEAIQDRE